MSPDVLQESATTYQYTPDDISVTLNAIMNLIALAFGLSWTPM